MSSKNKVPVQKGIDVAIERVFQVNNYPIFLKYLADMHHFDWFIL